MFEMFYCIDTQTDSKVLVNLKCSFSILSFFFLILIVNLNRRSIDTFHKQHN